MTSSTILFVCQESPDENFITSLIVTIYEYPPPPIVAVRIFGKVSANRF